MAYSESFSSDTACLHLELYHLTINNAVIVFLWRQRERHSLILSCPSCASVLCLCMGNHTVQTGALLKHGIECSHSTNSLDFVSQTCLGTVQMA